MSMLKEISMERIQTMTEQELRWLENAKKAFHASDEAFRQLRAEDECLQCLCRAIDTSKTLHRSLRDLSVNRTNNAKEFIDFIHLEIPRPDNNGVVLELAHARTGKKKKYGFGELVYEIRCMVHENENLNVEDGIDYHILIDWNPPEGRMFAELLEHKVIVNGPLLWRRLREVLSGFLSIVESMYHFSNTKKIEANIWFPYGSMGPGHSGEK